ncbi:hypothetical protein [Halomonas binhaiensis]|uniref:Uncharacterized protein n=1 Tax=Halomonas binhaiensis TaxID=2562282 RepID=A0A5C1NLD7_9GAMM|nr:hypothetical protein [Halomonas binhaiensis]QEM83531.1 hypothetical protein E4T21_19675 [Halomonas binhaiensis]
MLPSKFSSTRRPRLTLLITLTLIALGMALWYLLRYEIAGHEAVEWHVPEQVESCDLHRGSCSADLGDGARLTLSIPVDGDIRPLEPLPLDVQISGIEATGAVVSFEGVDMDMGVHRFPLTASGSGHFQGQGQVGICTRDRMMWRVLVVLDTPRGPLGSWFDLEVQYPGNMS